MTNHHLINASGKTHAKIAFVAVAMSAVFVALISASAITKSDAAGTGVANPVIKASAAVKLATSDSRLVR